MLADPDPHYDNVTLLAPLLVDFNDYSQHRVRGLTPTAALELVPGGGRWGTPGPYFRGGAMGETEDYNRLALPAALDPCQFDQRNWTIEAHIRLDEVARGGHNRGLCSNTVQHANTGFLVYTGPNERKLTHVYKGDNPGVWAGQWIFQETEPLPLAEWVHWAWVRDGNWLRIFLEGVLSVETALTGPLYDGTQDFDIGCIYQGVSNSFWKGGICDFRVTDGIARYTGPFTPPSRLDSPIGYSLRYRELKNGANNARLPLGSTAISAKDGKGIDRVVVLEQNTQFIAGDVTPDYHTGAWQVIVPPGMYFVIYYEAGCAPVVHGPYEVVDL